MKSIICNAKRCYICSTSEDLHLHHIFEGTANRAQSEKYGCWVYLCPYHHNMSDYGVHFNKPFEIALKKHAQERFEAIYGDRKAFIKAFGKSYIWD